MPCGWLSPLTRVFVAGVEPGESARTSPNLGRDTSSCPSGAKASSRAPGTRAQTDTVQPGGACSVRVRSKGAVRSAACTVVLASSGTAAVPEDGGTVAAGAAAGEPGEQAARVSTRPAATAV